MKKCNSLRQKILSSLLAAAMIASMPMMVFAAGSSDGNNDAAQAQSFEIYSENARRAEDDQNIYVKISFDREIQVKEGAEDDVILKIAGGTLEQAPNTESGKPNRTLDVSVDSTDKKVLVVHVGSVPGSQFIKQTNASIEIQLVENANKIVTAANGVPVVMKKISTVIPTGLALTKVSSQTGSSGVSASVTKKVTHRSNLRSMVYIQVTNNGSPIFPTEYFDHDGSYVIHAHAFVDTTSGNTILKELTEADYAKLIVQGFNNSAAKYPEIASRYEMKQDGDKVIFTDKKSENGEVLDLIIMEWPHMGSEFVEKDKASGNGQKFTDVNGWEKEYVYYLVDRGIVSGRSETIFDPSANITRAEFVKLLAVATESFGETLDMNKQSTFTDVGQNEWFTPYVAWAQTSGVVYGYDGRFSPRDNITRQDMAVMIQRFAGKMNGAQLPEMEQGFTFGDENQISDYAYSAVKELQKTGIISGDVNGKFYPKSSATRGQASKMLAVFLQVNGK